MSATTTINQDEITLPSGKKCIVNTAQKFSTSATSNVPVYVQLSSAVRIILDAKKQAEHANNIINYQHAKFKPIDMGDNLEKLVGVHTCLETTERHFSKFDLMDTFLIVKPDRDPVTNEVLCTLSKDPSGSNLFKDYASLTLDQVIASSPWYATFPTKQYHKDNMALTAAYLQAYTTHHLIQKINIRYKQCPENARGGPVLLFLLIGYLMSANDATAKQWITKLETIKISSYDGEDIDKVVVHFAIYPPSPRDYAFRRF